MKEELFLETIITIKIFPHGRNKIDEIGQIKIDTREVNLNGDNKRFLSWQKY